MKLFKINTGKVYHNDKVMVILSFVLAIILWIVVTLVIAPSTTRTVSGIPVAIDITDTETEKLGLNLVQGAEQTIQVTVRGKRTVVAALTRDDFIATAVLKGVNEPGKYELPIDVRKANITADFVIESISSSSISATFDFITSKRLTIMPDLSGLAAASSYYLAPPDLTDTFVDLTGPQSELEKAVNAVIRVPPNNELTETLKYKGDIVLLNEQGQEIEASNIKMNIYQTNVIVPVLLRKQLPVVVDFSNAPPDFQDTGLSYTASPSKITLAGPKEQIESMESFKLGVIDFSLIDKENNVFNLDVVMPEGFYNINEVATVKININMRNFSSKNFSVTSFETLNVPPGQNVSFVTTVINDVRVVGPSSAIRNMKNSDIVAKVDLAGNSFASGQYELPVIISARGRNDCWSFGRYTAIVDISAS